MHTEEIKTGKTSSEDFKLKRDDKKDLNDQVKKTYSHQEALKSTLEYFKGDELAATVWINKYALKDSKGNLYEKSPDEMHRRLAREIARIEKKYPNPLTSSQIYSVLKDFKYIIPQGGPMTGIGNKYQVASLSNCFVIGHDKPAFIISLFICVVLKFF